MAEIGNIAKGTLVADAAKATAQAVGGIAKAALEVGKDFETSMSQVAATLGITTDEIAAGSKEFEMLTAKAKEMGATTKYTASEASEGLNILAMAGLSAEEACAGIADVMALAGAGAISLEQAATYTTGAVKGFNDSMENAAKYTDIMAKGATMANTDVNMLGAALSGASASANAYNQSVESTSVALLRLAEQNVTGQEAATALNRAMADLYTPTDKAATALAQLGINTYDEAGNARDLNVVIDELNGVLSGMSDQEKLAYESTIFTTYGMKAFQKMTVSTTEKVDQFKKGIAEASGSAMQQFETQTDNLEGKLAILNSALEATGIAIYDVFGDKLKDAVGGATDIIDEIHDSIENGELKETFENLAESLGNFAESALELGKDALPGLLNGLSFILDNSGAIIMAFVGYKAATIAQTVATAAQTIAQLGLNGAVEAFPLTWLIQGIGILVGAFAGLAIETEKTAHKMSDVDEEASKLASAQDKMNSSLEETSQKYKDSMESIGGNASKARELTKELDGLSQKTTKTAADHKRMAAIVDELNTIYPELGLSIDETTGKLSMETQEIMKNIDAWEEQLKLEVYSDRAKEAMQERMDQEEQLNKLHEERNKLYEEQQKLEERAEELRSKNSGEARSELAQIKAQLENNTEAQEANNQAIVDANVNISNLNNTYDECISQVGEMKTATEGAAEAQTELATATEEVDEALQKEKESLQEALIAEVTSFDAVTEASKHSKEELLKNLEEQNVAMTEWAEGMATLAAKGIDDGILSQLADMGISGKGYLDAFNSMTGEELDKYVALWEENTVKAMQAGDTLSTEYMTAGTNATLAWIDGAWQPINDGQIEEIPAELVNQVMNSPAWEQMPEEAKQPILDAKEAMKQQVDESAPEIAEDIGGGIVDAEIQGIKDKQEELNTAITESATETLNTMSEAFGIVGGSGGGAEGGGQGQGQGGGGGASKTKEIGTAIIQGLIDGLTDKEVRGKLDNTDKELVEAVKKPIDEGLKQSEFETIGRNIGLGLAAGIRASIDEAVAAAQEMAAAVNAASAAAFEERSPSRVFKRMGVFLGEGLAIGIEDGTPASVEASETMAKKCIAGFAETINPGSLSGSVAANIQSDIATLAANQEGGGFNQTINMYSAAQTPDEIAREIRLETKYGILRGSE